LFVSKRAVPTSTSTFTKRKILEHFNRMSTYCLLKYFTQESLQLSLSKMNDFEFDEINNQHILAGGLCALLSLLYFWLCLAGFASGILQELKC
jgi:hypothetical protein